MALVTPRFLQRRRAHRRIFVGLVFSCLGIGVATIRTDAEAPAVSTTPPSAAQVKATQDAQYKAMVAEREAFKKKVAVETLDESIVNLLGDPLFWAGGRVVGSSRQPAAPWTLLRALGDEERVAKLFDAAAKGGDDVRDHVVHKSIEVLRNYESERSCGEPMTEPTLFGHHADGITKMPAGYFAIFEELDTKGESLQVLSDLFDDEQAFHKRVPEWGRMYPETIPYVCCRILLRASEGANPAIPLSPADVETLKTITDWDPSAHPPHYEDKPTEACILAAMAIVKRPIHEHEPNLKTQYPADRKDSLNRIKPKGLCRWPNALPHLCLRTPHSPTIAANGSS